MRQDDCGSDEAHFRTVTTGVFGLILLLPLTSAPLLLRSASAQRFLGWAIWSLALVGAVGLIVEIFLLNRDKAGFRASESATRAVADHRGRRSATLARAIRAGHIHPYYQPLVAIPNRRMVGFEVLARWCHDSRGLVMPEDFIPVAEEAGLLPELTDSILRQACADARHWPDHLNLSINIAPSQLRDPLFAARIISIIRAEGFLPQRLEIEITENALVEEPGVVRQMLASLRAIGIRIALDDFGIGYSGLCHLRELRLDKIKLDKSFIRALDAGEEKEALVRAMIGLGKSLGLATTAEGVEDHRQLSRMRAWGCDYGQGHLFGEAMPSSQAGALIADMAKSAGVGERVQQGA